MYLSPHGPKLAMGQPNRSKKKSKLNNNNDNTFHNSNNVYNNKRTSAFILGNSIVKNIDGFLITKTINQ